MFEQIPLKDIHLPDPISWWPPAIGWWLLGLFVLVALILLFITAKRFLERRKKLKEIRTQNDWLLGRISEIEKDYQQKGDAVIALQALSELLRRVVLTYFNDSNAGLAGKTGEEYIDWMVTSVPGEWKRDTFSHLINEPYKKHSNLNATEVLVEFRHWSEQVCQQRVLAK